MLDLHREAGSALAGASGSAGATFNVNDPNATLSSPLYGTINSTRKPMRELQIGVKFVF